MRFWIWVLLILVATGPAAASEGDCMGTIGKILDLHADQKKLNAEIQKIKNREIDELSEKILGSALRISLVTANPIIFYGEPTDIIVNVENTYSETVIFKGEAKDAAATSITLPALAYTNGKEKEEILKHDISIHPGQHASLHFVYDPRADENFIDGLYRFKSTFFFSPTRKLPIDFHATIKTKSSISPDTQLKDILVHRLLTTTMEMPYPYIVISIVFGGLSAAGFQIVTRWYGIYHGNSPPSEKKHLVRELLYRDAPILLLIGCGNAFLAAIVQPIASGVSDGFQIKVFSWAGAMFYGFVAHTMLFNNEIRMVPSLLKSYSHPS